MKVFFTLSILICACNKMEYCFYLVLMRCISFFVLLDCEIWIAPSQIDESTPYFEGFSLTDPEDNCRFTQFSILSD